MKKYFLVLICMLGFANVHAQREFAVCDSTSFILNSDTTVIAGRNKLYLHANNTINTLYNFTSSDTNEYIRDFDIVKPNLWYTVVGLRYIGGPTRLYKSTNRGLSWSIDTSHYATTNSQFLSPAFLKSINNLQHLNGDTIIMFMHYYESGIIYSTDMGITWKKWFNNLITHYQGMLKCDNKYYIYGYEGDGFKSWMFGFNKHLLFTSDSLGQWTSFNINSNHPPCSTVYDTVNCIYAPFNLGRCGSYNYYKSFIDSLCAPLGYSSYTQTLLTIFPNPVNDILYLDFGSLKYNIGLKRIYIINAQGQFCYDNLEHSLKHTIDISKWAAGLYQIAIFDENNGNIIHTKFVKSN